MIGRQWMLGVMAVAVLAGCGSGGNSAGVGAAVGGSLDRQHQQARDALARYDAAFARTDGPRGFVPVGELTGQVGDWEPANGDNKAALLAGRVVVGAALPAAPQPTGKVVWTGGASQDVPLISADAAIKEMASSDTVCDCEPLTVTGARMSTVRVQTTRGPATVPAWEFTLEATAVRLTRVAVAPSAMIKVTPPSWDPNDAPAGLAIESASTTLSSRQLTVSFTGAPEPATRPCGVDYTGEVVESAHAVVVIVIQHRHADGETCLMVGAPRTTTVELAQPLGERAVLEVREGLPVPVTITT